MENDDNDDKKIEIVNGSGDDLDISPVYTHINMNKKPNDDYDNNKNIIIPEEKK